MTRESDEAIRLLSKKCVTREARDEIAELNDVGHKLERVRARRTFLAMSAGLGAAALSSFVPQAHIQAGDAGFPGSTAEFSAAFQSIQKHENAHVAAIKAVMGGAARPLPTFQNLQQSSLAKFLVGSRTFENTGCGAYLTALPSINNPDYQLAAASIALVEGRHAGFLNVATGQPITVNDANTEMRLSAATVYDGVKPFIKSLNGGPPLTFNTARSASNDVSILNFALALEYLEAAYYNINVPIYYPASSSSSSS